MLGREFISIMLKEPLSKENDNDPIGHWYLYRIPKERILDWYPEGLEILQMENFMGVLQKVQLVWFFHKFHLLKGLMLIFLG